MSEAAPSREGLDSESNPTVTLLAVLVSADMATLHSEGPLISGKWRYHRVYGTQVEGACLCRWKQVRIQEGRGRGKVERECVGGEGRGRKKGAHSVSIRAELASSPAVRSSPPSSSSSSSCLASRSCALSASFADITRRPTGDNATWALLLPSNRGMRHSLAGMEAHCQGKSIGEPVAE